MKIYSDQLGDNDRVEHIADHLSSWDDHKSFWSEVVMCEARGTVEKIDNSAEMVYRAEQAMIEKDWLAAIALWAEVRGEFPNLKAGYGKAAIALRNARNFEASDELVFEMGRRFGTTAGQLVTLGDTSMNRKDWHSAIERWERLRTAFPEIPQGYNRASQALRALSRLEEADEMSEKSMQKFGLQPACLANYAENAMAAKNWPVAIERWHKFRKYAPQDAKGYVRAAIALVHNDQAMVADKLLAEGMQYAPSEAVCRQFVRSARTLDLSLDEHIDRLRIVQETGLPCDEFSGSLELLRKSQFDNRLLAILDGDTSRRQELHPDGLIRVVFYFPTIIQTDNLTPLYEKMHSDPRFDPIILCSKNRNSALSCSHSFYDKKYPAKNGHRVIDGGLHVDQNVSIYELDADVVFYHTPYSHSKNFPFF